MRDVTAFNFPVLSTRRDALTLFAGAICSAVPGVAISAEDAKKKDKKASKSAKGFELCLSQCLYDCTTPKAGAAKTRADCRVECKDECAVSRDQLY